MTLMLVTRHWLPQGAAGLLNLPLSRRSEHISKLTGIAGYLAATSQTASISSSEWPFVSGTIFQTNKAARMLIAP
jgi:hypothetical protein